MFRSTDRLIHYICCLFVWLLLSAPLPAFSAVLSMDYSLGFNGRFQIKKWTPLTITLENRGRAISGALEIIVTSGSEYRQDVHQTIYSMDVELPYNSKKLCSFTILITSVTHEVVIRLRKTQRILISKSLNLRPYYTSKPLALVPGSRISPDFLSKLPKSIFPVHGRPRFLPETWYGYDGVKAVIISPETINNMRGRQYQALTQWAKQGGFLITAGGINYGPLLDKKTMRLLPIKILGHKNFFQLKALETFCGQKLIDTDPFLVLDVNIENSNVLIQENDIPIIIEKKIGIGKIIFISLDFLHPPFSRWTGRQIFWDKILSLRPSNDAKGIDFENRKIIDFMVSKITANFPDIKLTLLFLLVYFLLLKFFFKRLETYRDKKWKNCCYILSVITIFSTASYFLFFYPNHKKSLTANSFLHINMAGRDAIASGKKIIGLYSIKDNKYSLSLGSLSHPVSRINYGHAKNTPSNIVVLQKPDSGQRVIGSSKKWSHTFFVVNLKFAFNIAGRALQDDQGLKMTIENNTPFNIIDCLVYFDNRFFFLGNILPDKEQVKRIAKSDMDKTNGFDGPDPESLFQNSDATGVSSFLKTMNKDLIKDLLLAVQSKYKYKRENVCVLGWIHSGVIQTPFAKPCINGEGLTLITWEVPVKIPVQPLRH